MTKLNESVSESKVIIGEATPIRIGLVILLFGVLVSSVWWAATITSKLDTLITYQTATSASMAELKVQVDNLKLRVALNEAGIKTLQDSKQAAYPNNISITH